MFKEHLSVYRSLNRNKVKYLVVGGIAAIIYGAPRTTLDLDLMIEPTLKNARLLLHALKQIHIGTAYLTTPENILKNEITVFEDYIRLDVLTTVKGINFYKAWKRRCHKRIQNVTIKLLSLSDVIKSKRASNRVIDKEDLIILKKIIKTRT